MQSIGYQRLPSFGAQQSSGAPAGDSAEGAAVDSLTREQEMQSYFGPEEDLKKLASSQDKQLMPEFEIPHLSKMRSERPFYKRTFKFSFEQTGNLQSEQQQPRPIVEEELKESPQVDPPKSSQRRLGRNIGTPALKIDIAKNDVS